MPERNRASSSVPDPAGLHRMAYVEWGDPHNPRVLVCVHGLTRRAATSRRWRRRWRDTIASSVPTWSAAGVRDWLRDPMRYLVPQYVADCVTLVARLTSQSVRWVGTSMGGFIGISLAGSRSRRSRGW